MSLNAVARSANSSVDDDGTWAPRSPAATLRTPTSSFFTGRENVWASNSDARATATMIPAVVHTRRRVKSWTGANASDESISAMTIQSRSPSRTGA